MKTNELTGAALDWAVAKACLDDTLAIYFDEDTGEPLHRDDMDAPEWNPSTNWSQAGPIIERECMEFDYDEASQVYTAANGVHAAQGKTHLIAAMRCYVASRIGDEVDVPDELN